MQARYIIKQVFVEPYLHKAEKERKPSPSLEYSSYFLHMLYIEAF